MTAITPITVLVRNARPMTAAVADEVVLLDADQGCYFGLDRSGAAIWELLATPRSVAEVCDRLVQRFDVPPEICRSEVIFFLHDMREAGLVRTVEPTENSG
jgi:Coenzyme PQQ synthesis protein D (PqqD)